jgi:hypothetical protein
LREKSLSGKTWLQGRPKQSVLTGQGNLLQRFVKLKESD